MNNLQTNYIYRYMVLHEEPAQLFVENEAINIDGAISTIGNFILNHMSLPPK